MTHRSFFPSVLCALTLLGCPAPYGECTEKLADGTLVINADCGGKDSGTPDDDTANADSGDSDSDSGKDSDSGSDTDSVLDTDSADSGDSDSGETGETGDTADSAEDTAGPIDADSDGFSADDDCDDGNAAINPDAIEICDSVDNNCNGVVDTDAADQIVFYADADSDGYGDAALSVLACDPVSGYVIDGTDCDDTDDTVYPYAVEDCSATSDLNCDGSFGSADADSDGVVACEDCDDTNAAMFPGGTEVCDGFDNDCEGTVDEGATDSLTWCEDSDSDSYGNFSVTASACTEPSGYVADSSDCDDTNAGINPGEVEVCNDADDDCSGVADDGLPVTTSYRDSDGDSFGDSLSTTGTCDGTAPGGYVFDATDCNDSDSGVNPGELEICNSVDDDCNGSVDDSAVDALNWYRDADNDGFGNASISIVYCSEPSGYTADATDCDDTNSDSYPGNVEWCDLVDNDCSGSVDDGDYDADGYDVCADCDDGDASLNPGEPEVCDGDDNDCDGVVDDGLNVTYYQDTDSDGYGNSASSTTSCSGAPAGYVSNSTDCNDSASGINPGATEVCNSTDDNCDGSTDEGVELTFYLDSDADGYGDPSISSEACSAPTDYVTDDTDCDDTRDWSYPGSSNPYCWSGVDADCDSAVGLADRDCGTSAIGSNLFTTMATWNGEDPIGSGDATGFTTMSGSSAISDCTTANTDSCSVKLQGPGSWSVTTDLAATSGSLVYCFFSTHHTVTAVYAGVTVTSGTQTINSATIGVPAPWAVTLDLATPTILPTMTSTVAVTIALASSDALWIDALVCQQ